MPIDIAPPVMTPPAIYRDVKQFRRIEDRIMPADDVARICWERAIKYHFSLPAVGHVFLGCSLWWPDRCEIVRINRNDVRDHELAHCAGWGADHPMR
jgi:hypothetical protein